MSISSLRKYISEELESNEKVNLVDVLAKFDFYQHAIPTTNQMRQAIKGMKFLDVERIGENINLVKTNSQIEDAHKKITQVDMKNTYNLYIEKLKKK